VDGGGCWTPTLDQIAMKRLFGRWFSGSSGVLGTVKSERKGGRSTCEIFGEEKFPVRYTSPRHVLKGHKAASWHDCRRKEGSFSGGVSSGFSQMPARMKTRITSAFS
jgi:hypothetical protein